MVGGGGGGGDEGQSSCTFVSVRVTVLLEWYWEPSDRRIVSPQLKLSDTSKRLINFVKMHFVMWKSTCQLTRMYPNFQT